jgi:hypothetical protein
MLKLFKEKGSNEKKKVKPKEQGKKALVSKKNEGNKKNNSDAKKKKTREKGKIKRKTEAEKENDDGENTKTNFGYAKSVLKRTLIAFAPIVLPVFYSCVFIPLNNIMAGEPVSEAQILQTLMGFWIAIIIIAFLTDPMLFFPSFKEFNIRWSFPLIMGLMLMITGMLFQMYVSVGDDECLLDLQWEYPEEDPLSETGYEDVEDQVITPGFHFYGLARLPYLKKYSMETDDYDNDMEVGSLQQSLYKKHRMLYVNITRKYTTSDEKTRMYNLRAKIFVPCPRKLHEDALDGTIQQSFEKQMNDMEEVFETIPPKTDLWQTMSSHVFDRELLNFISRLTNDHLKFYYQNYGLTFFNLKMDFSSTV